MTRIISSFIFLLVACVFFTTAQAQTAADQLRELFAQTKTFQARFTQTVRDQNNTLLQTTHGTLYLQRPGKLRWEVQRPMQQVFVADGKKLWFYDKDLEQVTVKPLEKSVKNSPAEWLLSANPQLTQQYKITRRLLAQGRQQFDLQPKESKSTFKKISLIFTGHQLMTMRLEDNLQQKVTVQFSRIKQNQPISPSLFVFKPPAHVEVLKGL